MKIFDHEIEKIFGKPSRGKPENGTLVEYFSDRKVYVEKYSDCLFVAYNEYDDFIRIEAKKLGGFWDRDGRGWVFPLAVEELVAALHYEVCGEWDGQKDLNIEPYTLNGIAYARQEEVTQRAFFSLRHRLTSIKKNYSCKSKDLLEDEKEFLLRLKKDTETRIKEIDNLTGNTIKIS